MRAIPTIHRFEDRDSWLAARSPYVTGTDAPVIAGVGFVDPFTQWAKKTGKLAPSDDKLRFRVGHHMEKLIHDELTQRRELWLYDPGDFTMLVAPNGWQSATPDRLILDSAGGAADMELNDDLQAVEGIAQFKTVIEFMKGEWEDGPSEYTWIQMLHEMSVADVEWGVAAALIGLGDWRDFDLYQEAEALEALLEAEYRFHKHLKEDTPPPVGPTSRATLKALFPKSNIGTVHFVPPTTGWTTAVSDYDEAKAEVKRLTRELKEATTGFEIIQSEFLLEMGDNERLEIAGLANFTNKQQHNKGYTVEPFDYKVLRKVK